ncbi:hypothetical protein [Streptomyces sp. NPDC021020]|uniref:hypothetical protein n=1 Tax=Streptomyces sp. NPDC021020 TaxID=3365109 RepID=UPI0037BD19B2
MAEHVAPRGLDKAGWNNSTDTGGDPYEAVTRPKETDGKAVAGHGKRLFQDGLPATPPTVPRSEVFGSGVHHVVHAPARG